MAAAGGGCVHSESHSNSTDSAALLRVQPPCTEEETQSQNVGTTVKLSGVSPNEGLLQDEGPLLTCRDAWSGESRVTLMSSQGTAGG